MKQRLREHEILCDTTTEKTSFDEKSRSFFVIYIEKVAHLLCNQTGKKGVNVMAESYMQRKIDRFLQLWKEDDARKPLIVKGPRQVGKTESLLRFAKANYQSVIYLNFVEEPKYKMILEDGYGTEDIIKNISRIDPSKRFEIGNTVLFFDEIQAFS